MLVKIDSKEMPIAIVYDLKDEKVIRLTVRVGPMDEVQKTKRDELICILNDKIKSNKKSKKGEDITRVWSNNERVNDDFEENESARLKARFIAMSNLYNKLNKDAVLLKIADSINDVWK